MILGIYYLTVNNDTLKDEYRIFKDVNEVLISLDNKVLEYQSIIYVKINNKMIKTTPGRVIFNESINNVLRKMGLDDIEFVNHVIGKKDVSILIYNLYIKYGNKIISKILNSLKSIGFKYSTLSGLSISIEDLTIPDKKLS